MTKIKKIARFIADPDYRFIALAERGFYIRMPDEEFIKRMYRAKFGKTPDLDHPTAYTEKLQWLKLHDRRPEYTTLVDKYAVKEFVEKRIGKEYVIPTLGVWDRFDDINFSQLPDQFVLKTTHDSGGVVICQNKAEFDREKARKKIEKSLRSNFYSIYREWPYKNVKPRILAETYMEDTATGELRDYKFFTFDGKVKALYIASNRQNAEDETRFDFFDENYRHLPFTNGHPNALVPPAKPVLFDEMKEVAEKLANGFHHVRVDLYEVNGKIYFGELTICHWSGFVPFEPEEWDEKFGSWLTIP